MGVGRGWVLRGSPGQWVGRVALGLVVACGSGGPGPGAGDGDRCVSGDADTCRAGDLGPLGTVRVVTDPLLFVDVPRGDVAFLPLRVANDGTGALSVQRINIVGGANRLTVTPAPGSFSVAVPAGGEFTFQVGFGSIDGASFSAVVELMTDDPLRPVVPVQVLVSYTGVPELVMTSQAAGQQAEDLFGGSLDLGLTPVGVARPVTLYLKNLGSGGMFAVFDPPAVAAPLSLSLSPGPDGDGRHRLSPFRGTCQNTGDCTGAAACTAGVCTLAGVPTGGLRADLRITATAVGPMGAGIEIEYSAGTGGFRGLASLDLVAEGVTPGLWPRPTSVDFGSVAVGAPASALVTLTNANGDPVSVSGVSFAGGLAAAAAPVSVTSLDGLIPGQLPAFGVARLRLDFSPGLDGLGAWSGSLEIQGDQPLSVAVSGVAGP